MKPSNLEMSVNWDSRDLKPGNCLISLGRGGMPRVLVGDFGEGNVEGSGKVGTGTIEVRNLLFWERETE